MNESVFLIGFMGSGKSEVGRLLSAQLKRPFIDLDAEIERVAGKRIAAIFAEEGEAGFRRRETEALLHAGKTGGAGVSCGGGVVVTPDNRAFLLSQPWVFRLLVSPEAVFARVGNDPKRPLLQGGDPLPRIRKLMEEREPWYALFSQQVETEGFRSSEVAQQIFSEIRKKSGPM